MRAIVCQSDAGDSTIAVAELIAQATEQLDGAVPKAALLFASSDYDHATLLSSLQDRWPGLPLVGGTSDGEVASVRGFHHDSAVLTLLTGDRIRAHVGLGRDLSKNIGAAIDQAMAQVGTVDARICITMFAPSTNSSEVVRLLQPRLGGARCPIVGGLTGDHAEYSRMVEFCNGEVLKDSLPILVLEGDLAIGTGIGTGWFPVGEPKEVTSSDGHIVHTIGGRPAIQVFRDYWGTVPEDSLGEYPLAVYPGGPDGLYFLRAVLGSDAATGSIRLAGEVPLGATIRLTEVLADGILSGSESAAAAACENYPGKDPQLALVFSCAARKWVLGTQAEKECAMLQAAFARSGVKAALAGLYVFGEIAPNDTGGPSHFHNETCVAVLLGR